MAWTRAACAADIKPGQCLGVELGGEHVALFNIEGRFHATSNICTHQLAYLTEGYLEGEFIECPLHQGRFNVTNGEAEGPPVSKPLRVFPIRVEGADVMVDTAAGEG